MLNSQEKKELHRLEFFTLEVPHLLTQEDKNRIEYLNKKRVSDE